MHKVLRLALLLAFTVVSLQALGAADKKLGKIFIKAAPAADGFADPGLEDSVKDLKKRSAGFAVVEAESEADFLLVVVERKIEMRSPAGTPVNYKLINATLSVREADKWKPAVKLSNSGSLNGGSWGVAAGSVISEAEKWVKKSRGKQ